MQDRATLNFIACYADVLNKSSNGASQCSLLLYESYSEDKFTECNWLQS